MNKTELIGCVAEKSGLAKKDAEKRYWLCEVALISANQE